MKKENNNNLEKKNFILSAEQIICQNFKSRG